MDLKSRISTLLQKASTCDVVFIVGEPPEKFACHKVILAAGSQVFEAMFYGCFPQTSTIELSDVSPAGFDGLVQYLYTDKLKMESVVESFEVAYAAQKYMVDPLFESCEKYIQKHVSITPENVFTLYEEANFLEMKELKQMCLRYFSRNAKKIFRSKSFENASTSTLEDILKLDIMDIDSECDLIEALWNWASAQCIIKEMECSSENMRKFTKGFLKHIRVNAVTVEELAKMSSRRSESILHLSEKMADCLNIEIAKELRTAVLPSDVSQESRSRSITNCRRITVPVRYYYSGNLSTSFIIDHAQTTRITVDKKQITLVGFLIAYKPVPCYSPDHRTLDIEITIQNVDSHTLSTVKSFIKLNDNSKNDQQCELILEDYIVISPKETGILNVITKSEGVLITECSQQSFMESHSGVQMVIDQQNEGERIVFPIKEILYI